MRADSGRSGTGRRGARPPLSGALLLPAACVLWAAWALGSHEWRGLPGYLGALTGGAAGAGSFSLPGFAVLWARRAASLAVFLAFQAGCLGWGSLLLRWMGIRPDLAIGLVAGWAVAGFAGWGAALSGLASPAVLALLVLVPLAFRPRLPRPAAFAIPRDAPGPLAAAAAAAGLAVVIVAGLAPETQVDPLVYHLGRVRQILLAGRFAADPLTLYDMLPPLWEMALLPLEAAGGEAATRWFPPLVALLVAVLVFRGARRVLPGGWAVAGGALFATSPFVAMQATQAKNDLFLTALGMAAAIRALEPAGPAGRRAGRRRGGSTGLAAGWLAGAAFCVKYTAGPLVVAVAAGLLLARLLSGRRLVLLAAGFLAAAAPLLAHHWLVSGNPVYPVAPAAFPSPWFDAAAAARLNENLYGVTLQDPGAVSKWRNFEGLWSPSGTEETLLRWAVWCPMLVLVPAWGTALRFWGGVLGALAVAWALGPPPVRYGLPMFPAGALMASVALASLGRRFAAGGGRAILAIALALQLAHLVGVPQVLEALPAGIGLEAPADWRAGRLTTLAVAAGAVAALTPPEARILLHGEGRVAVFPRRARAAAFSSVAFPPFAAVHGSRTPEEAWKRLRQAGWTHVLYNRLTAFFWRRTMADDAWTARDLALWESVWRAHAEPVWESPTLDLQQGYFYLWRLVPRARTHSAAAIPGLEGWVFRMEDEIRAGRIEAVYRDLAVLQRAAGGYGIVDAIEAEMFRSRLSDPARRVLLERAVARGWRSPPVCLELAAMALREGKPDEARRWRDAAVAIEPRLGSRP